MGKHSSLGGPCCTAIGLCITFGSHFVADRLLGAQRVDKAAAQRRLIVSEAELEATKAKTRELEFRLAPRVLSDVQGAEIANKLKSFAQTQFEFVSYQEEAEGKRLCFH